MAVSMYSVTSQREPSPVTSGSEFLKRPLQHDFQSEVETNFEPAAKVKCSSGAGSGGGRRKQSRPIRVRSDVDPSAGEELVVDLKMPATHSPQPSGDLPAVGYSCQEGSEVQRVSFDVEDRKADPAVVFPTKYHQLGSELKQEVGLNSYVGGGNDGADGKPDSKISEKVEEGETDLDDPKRSPQQYFDRRDTELVADVKPFNQFSHSLYKPSQVAQSHEQSSMPKFDCLPTNLSLRTSKLESPGNGDVYSMQASGRGSLVDVDLSRTELQEGERFWDGSDAGSGVEKTRIFHPDAYCDICDREFCNKYFLKTHRANKHGIYDGSSSDPGPYSSSSTPALSAPVFSQAPAMESAANLPLLDRDHPMLGTSSLSSSSAPSLSGVLPIPQLPSNLGVLPFDDAPPPPPPPPAPTRGSDMEDYCDICQKHFCNKYYLRKHRQDVHGLTPADVAARRSQIDFTRVSTDVTESSTTPHFSLRVSSSASSSTLPPTAPPTSALGNFPMFLPPPFGTPLPVVPPFLPGAAGLGFGSLQFGADGGGSKLSTSSSSQQQLSGGSSSLLPGLMSHDAYMDLFRKELLGGYLMNNGDRDVTAAIAAVAAAAAAAASSGDPSVPGPPRLPPLPTTGEHGALTTSIPTPDTFAEMLQRIGARIGKKNDGLGSLPHDLFRLNGLGVGAGRLPGSATSTPSSTSSSRLVDRVVCDLCNKEVCNKYFLKTHKMKVHGWDPNTSTVPAVNSTAPAAVVSAETAANKSEPLSSTQPPLMYLPPLPSSHGDKQLSFPPSECSGLTPKEVELQRMGIDPEAYCDICRKEFCSKYFLRTHMQNIHGIQDASKSSSPASYHLPSAASAPMFSSAAAFSSISLPPPPLSLPSTLSNNCSTSPSSSSSLFLFGGAGLGNNESSGSSDGHAAEQRSWKWKEPVNATRVSCTLCNKVLCNKYFLRTHMAKRHGVTVDTRLQPPAPPPPIRDLIQSPSNHPPSNGVSQYSTDTAVADLVDHKEAECSVDSGKTGAVNLVLSGRSSTDVQTVTARTWQVPADDTPPQSDTFIQPDTPTSVTAASGPPALKQLVDDSVKCPLCAAAMADRDVLLRHLTSVHHVDEQMVLSLVSPAARTSSADHGESPGATSLDGFAAHQIPRPPTIGAGGGGAIRRRRQFRCAFCRERFRTRVHCELHARAAHPRASGSFVEVTPAVETVDRTSPTPPSTSVPLPVYATPLDANDAARAQMLPFILRESLVDGADPSSTRFSTALIYLPTFRPLTSPTNVTFTLTPVVQP